MFQDCRYLFQKQCSHKCINQRLVSDIQECLYQCVLCSVNADLRLLIGADLATQYYRQIAIVQKSMCQLRINNAIISVKNLLKVLHHVLQLFNSRAKTILTWLLDTLSIQLKDLISEVAGYISEVGAKRQICEQLIDAIFIKLEDSQSDDSESISNHHLRVVVEFDGYAKEWETIESLYRIMDKRKLTELKKNLIVSLLIQRAKDLRKEM